MAFVSSVTVINSGGKPLTFHLEPWGEQIEMPPAAKFVVAAEAQSPGSFEIEFGAGEIIVWAWSGSTAKVFCEGNEVGDFAGLIRPVVPPIP
jgi:hypothetical protein